jgi:hypothetical protein
LRRDTLGKNEGQRRLNKLLGPLGAIRFMDPACGCGNFIIVAYRELRDLELQVMEALYDLRDKHQLSLDAKSDLKVTLDHFYGIEIDEWPARIAETAMFMIDRQCDLKLQERFGQAPERLPIQREAKIVVGRHWLACHEPSATSPSTPIPALHSFQPTPSPKETLFLTLFGCRSSMPRLEDSSLLTEPFLGPV